MRIIEDTTVRAKVVELPRLSAFESEDEHHSLKEHEDVMNGQETMEVSQVELQKQMFVIQQVRNVTEIEAEENVEACEALHPGMLEVKDELDQVVEELPQLDEEDAVHGGEQLTKVRKTGNQEPGWRMGPVTRMEAHKVLQQGESE